MEVIDLTNINEIDTYKVALENSKEIIMNPTQAQLSVPPFIETIIRFEDTKYFPNLETCITKIVKTRRSRRLGRSSRK